MSVHHLDLRGTILAEARARVRERFGPGSPLTGSTRLLLLDDTDRLVEHADAYEDALVSGRVSTVVCVAVGGLSDGPGGARLDRPGHIGGGRGVTTLWVDDETGVDWVARRFQAPQPHPGAAPGSGIGLYTLVDLLHLPEVFDRVVSLGESLPESTASPGVLWAGSETGTDTVVTALTRAARELTSRERPADPPNPPPPTGAPLVDLVEGAHRGASEVAASGDGGLRAQEGDLHAWLTHTETALDALTGWTGPVAATTPRRLVAEDLPGLAGALASCRDRAETVLAGLGTPSADRSATGAARPGGGGADTGGDDHGKALRALADRPRRVLDHGGTLADAAADLDRAAARLRPSGGRAALPGVRRAVPDDLLDAFRRPPPVPVPAPLPELLPVALAAPLLPALAGGGTGATVALVVAAGWVALLALTLRRLREPDGATLGAHAVAALAGVLAGTGAAALLGPASPLAGPVTAVVGGLLGVGLGLASTAVSWSWRVRRWRARLGTERVGPAVSELTRLVDRTVRDEERLSGARTRLSDTAIAAASAVRAVDGALAELAERGTPSSGRGPDQENAAHLESLLRADLVDLTTTALGPVWDEARAATGRAVDPHERVRRTAADLADGLLDHLGRAGPYEPPAFADPGRERATPGGVASDRVARVLDHDLSGRMLQLCDPAHLALLDTGSGAPPGVRFAPRALLPGTRGDGRGDTVWTAGGHLVGVLRLVPLRPGAVRTDWHSGHGGGGHG